VADAVGNLFVNAFRSSLNISIKLMAVISLVIAPIIK
jgi:Na+/H+-translocating membrane pyrophosphatase